MSCTLKVLAEQLHCQVLGDSSLTVSGIASIGSASPSDLVFIENAKNLDQALASRAAAIISEGFAGIADQQKPVLITSQPRLAFARAAKLLLENGRKGVPGVHESAVVHSSARISSNVQVDCG